MVTCEVRGHLGARRTEMGTVLNFPFRGDLQIMCTPQERLLDNLKGREQFELCFLLKTGLLFRGSPRHYGTKTVRFAQSPQRADTYLPRRRQNMRRGRSIQAGRTDPVVQGPPGDLVDPLVQENQGAPGFLADSPQKALRRVHQWKQLVSYHHG